MPECLHSFNRRCKNHDYRSRYIYMITMLKSAQAPLFSSITPDPSAAKVSPIVEIYPAGKIIYESLRWLTAKYPALRVLRAIAMPDHIHFELFVTEPTEMALGNMIAAFKSTCTNRFREKFPESSIALDDIPLFEDGFNDKIALRSGAKDAFYNYIADNPRRYLVKKLYSHFFFHKLLIEIDGQKCGLYGNIFLLDSPVKSFVKLSRIPERTPNLHQSGRKALSRYGSKQRKWHYSCRRLSFFRPK